MKKWLFQRYLYTVFLIVCLSFLSCQKEENDPLQISIYKIFKEWYLWYNAIQEIDPMLYNTPDQLLEAIRYKPLDRWSFVITKDEYEKYYIEGKYFGHGFGYGVADDGSIRITMIFKNSDLYNKGVRRGWIIRKINNVIVTNDNILKLIGENKAGISNTFTFGRSALPDTTIISVKKEVQMEMILLDTIFNYASKKIGYIVLYSFISDADKEIEKIFERFKQQGVNELIVDLRYNTGGFVDVGLLLASLITGEKNVDQIWAKFVHNEKKTSNNLELRIKTLTNSLNLNRVFFITTEATASTSEVMINGLKPLIPTYSLGLPTHGKPVGMYVNEIKEHGYVIFPVSFKIVNKNNEGDYFDGIPVDYEINDDLYVDFGNVHENLLAAAIYFIDKGTFPPQTFKVHKPMKRKQLNWWDRNFAVY